MISKLNKQLMNNLKREIITYVIISFLIGLMMYLILNFSGLYLINNYIEPKNVITETQKATASFQDFITENHLASTDQIHFSEWMSDRNNIFFFSLHKNLHGNQLAKQSDLKLAKDYKANNTNRKMLRNQLGLRNGIQVTEYITYSDGTFSTVFMYHSLGYMQQFCVVLSLIIAFIIFFISFYYLLKKKLDYIIVIEQGISIFESGCLDYAIPVKGMDELARLATSINEMSKSFKESIECEHRAREVSQSIIGDLSHDIRTPLTILSGYVPLLLKDDSLRVEQRTYLNIINKKTEQMRKRIDDLLSYATLYSKQLVINRSAIHLNQLIDQFTSELIPLGAQVTHFIDSDYIVYVDLNLLERVFDNISSNIVKYGDLSKSITIHCFQETSNAITVEVKNAVLEESLVNGSSLGLKISKYILSCHNGDLTTREEDGWYYTTLMIATSDSSTSSHQ